MPAFLGKSVSESLTLVFFDSHLVFIGPVIKQLGRFEAKSQNPGVGRAYTAGTPAFPPGKQGQRRFQALTHWYHWLCDILVLHRTCQLFSNFRANLDPGKESRLQPAGWQRKTVIFGGFYSANRGNGGVGQNEGRSFSTANLR